MSRTLLVTLAILASSVVGQQHLNESLADGEDLVVSRACRLGVWTCLKVRMMADLERAVAGDDFQLSANLALKRTTRDDGGSPRAEDDLPLGHVVTLLEQPEPSRKSFLDVVLLKKALDVFRSHSLTWRVGDRLNATVFRHDEGRGQMDLALQMSLPAQFAADGRTFGARKRIAMILLPIVFKLGVMSTLLMGLTVLVLKGLSIGVILLVLAFGNLFGKAATWHQPPPSHGWQPPPQDIHVHVHVDGQQQQHAYHGWHAAEQPSSHLEYPSHTAYARVDQGEDTPRAFTSWQSSLPE